MCPVTPTCEVLIQQQQKKQHMGSDSSNYYSIYFLKLLLTSALGISLRRLTLQP